MNGRSRRALFVAVPVNFKGGIFAVAALGRDTIVATPPDNDDYTQQKRLVFRHHCRRRRWFRMRRMFAIAVVRFRVCVILKVGIINYHKRLSKRTTSNVRR